jgi:tRNA(fMet)-specific endonuclease VapC
LKKYLLDTNICIFYIKGKHDLKKKFEKANPDNCFISEITLAELMYGVENSEKKEKNKKALDDFLSGIKIIPIFHSLDLYAKEKARLRKLGAQIDDFDLLIGATSVSNNLVMVTNNTDHFKRIKGITLEDWTK